MLIGCGVRMGGNPMRTMGGANIHAIERQLWAQRGTLNNFYAGEATVISGASIANKSAFPVGYVPPYCWNPAIKAGGLGSGRRLIGAGALSGANLAGGLNAAAPLTGSGAITNAGLALILSAVAALVGSGAITGAIRGRLAALAALSGAGDLDAALGAKASVIAALAGSGTVSGALLRAIASLAAEIVVTGTVLNTANVGGAVWRYLIDAGYSSEEILRLLASYAGGKVSGGPGSPVFRDLADTKNRITGTADSSGNRTAATYDLG